MKLYTIKDNDFEVAVCTELDVAMPLMFEHMKNVEGKRNEHPDYDDGEWETETVSLFVREANVIDVGEMMCLYRQGKDGFYLNVLIEGNKVNHYEENGNLFCVSEHKRREVLV